MDLAHLAPALANTYIDQHGMMQVWWCSFTNRFVASGNQTFPLTPNKARKIIAQTTGYYGGLEDLAEVQEEDEDSDGVTTLLHSSIVSVRESHLPPLPPDLPVASAVEPQPPAIQLIEDVQCQEQEGQTGEDNTLTDLTPFHLDGTMEEDEVSRASVAENKRFLSTGHVGPVLRQKLERFTEPCPVPRHRLHKECQACNKCAICMEGSPGYFLKLQTDSFRKYIVRTTLSSTDYLNEGTHPLATYKYTVRYVQDPSKSQLPVNYNVCLQRHMSLRRDFAKLPSSTKDEFVKRLTSGLEKDYWQVVQGDELTKMCQPGGGAHFLPAGYVLKDPEGSS